MSYPSQLWSSQSVSLTGPGTRLVTRKSQQSHCPHLLQHQGCIHQHTSVWPRLAVYIHSEIRTHVLMLMRQVSDPQPCLQPHMFFLKWSLGFIWETHPTEASLGSVWSPHVSSKSCADSCRNGDEVWGPQGTHVAFYILKTC